MPLACWLVSLAGHRPIASEVLEGGVVLPKEIVIEAQVRVRVSGHNFVGIQPFVVQVLPSDATMWRSYGMQSLPAFVQVWHSLCRSPSWAFKRSGPTGVQSVCCIRVLL